MTEQEKEEILQSTDAEQQPAEEVATDAASELQQAKEQLVVLQAELDEQKERYLRLQADYDNYRRRTQKEKSELSIQVTQDLIADLLPVVDNFERALAATGQDADSIRAGVEMVNRQFLSILEQNGLEAINTEDAPFDPNFHQAVMREENTDKPDGTILQELQKGYMVKGKTIRPSMVKVSFQ